MQSLYSQVIGGDHQGQTLGSTQSDWEEIKDIVLYDILPDSAAVCAAQGVPDLLPAVHSAMDLHN